MSDTKLTALTAVATPAPTTDLIYVVQSSTSKKATVSQYIITGTTDNALLRADGTGGATTQGSSITVSDLAASSVTVAPITPTATTGASQVGVSLAVTATPAVASTDTSGAAAGGSITLTGGAAARNTSGNANGGDIILVGGAGIGTGTTGVVQVPVGTAAAPSIAFSGDVDTGFYHSAANTIAFSCNGQQQFTLENNNGLVNTRNANGPAIGNSGGAPSSTVPGFYFGNDTNTGMGQAAADKLSLIAGGVETSRWSTKSFSRVSTQFDKTSDVTLADITGLSSSVAASSTYSFEAILYTSSNVAGGVQFAIGGTATATAIIYEAIVTNAGSVSAQTRATTIGTAVGGVTAVTAAYCRITGTITVNAAGTLTVQFAQNASNGTASSVLVGSSFTVRDNP